MKFNFRKKFVFALLSLIFALVCMGFAGCDLTFTSGTTSQSEVNAETLLSVREVIRQSNIAIDTRYYRNLGWVSRTEGTGMGSGVVVYQTDTTYYALTNNHVITPELNGTTYNTQYTITDINGVEYTGKVEARNADYDIAIVSFTKSDSSVLGIINYTARLDSNVKAGEFVLAVGNPSGVKNIVTYGKVAGYAKINDVDYNVINHTALINPGNSGGALCDINGNLLGLNTWGTTGRDDNNFAIPLSIINQYISAFLSAKFPTATA
jgi:S1-C subfamily serine protease